MRSAQRKTGILAYITATGRNPNAMILFTTQNTAFDRQPTRLTFWPLQDALFPTYCRCSRSDANHLRL